MSKDELEALASRVEALSGADQEVDALIRCAVFAPTGSYVRQSQFNGAWCIYDGKRPNGAPRLWQPFHSFSAGYNYTASLDAAMTLAPTDGSMNMLDIEISWEPGRSEVWSACTVRWHPPHKSGPNWHAQISSGATPALALVAATLHARARVLIERTSHEQ